jgi:hypothetical protein
MLTEKQKSLILDIAISSMKYQKNVNLKKEDLDVTVREGNEKAACSLLIFSKSARDQFRMKLYVTGLSSQTNTGVLAFTQSENFSTGLSDEMFVTDVVLERDVFHKFYSHATSPQFAIDSQKEVGMLKQTDGGGFILSHVGKFKLRFA